MIPDYQTLMLPFLKVLADEKAHHIREAEEQLSDLYKLTAEELNELLPSGKDLVFKNRVGWARTYLKKAGLIENDGRGIFKITARGKDTLKQNLKGIDVNYLRKFPEFLEFQNAKRIDLHSTKDKSGGTTATKTPEELIETGYQNIRNSLQQELLLKLKVVHPAFFERIVIQLLVKMGYGGSIVEAGMATRYTNDEGIDGIIKEDKLGLDVIYIQAKRWEGIVGRPELQKFVGALAGQRAKKGVFITTSNFSKEAVMYASQMDTKIVLIDGEQLAQYMIDYNLGVSVQNTYEIKKIDSDYFEEE